MNEEGNANIEDLIEVVDVEEQDDDGNEISNTTFINPSQGDLLPSGIIFKCQICDFVSQRIML